MPRGVPNSEVGRTVTLTRKEQEILQRLMGAFPPGVLNPSRVARMCIQAGAPIVEAQLRERAEEYARSSAQVAPEPSEET